MCNRVGRSFVGVSPVITVTEVCIVVGIIDRPQASLKCILMQDRSLGNRKWRRGRTSAPVLDVLSSRKSSTSLKCVFLLSISEPPK